jgi:thioredoxin:protein disulfide reductase
MMPARPPAARRSSRFHVALALLALAAPARAQQGAPPPPAETLVHASAAPVTIAAGGRGEALVHVSVAAGWHINGNPPSPDYMIATEVTMSPVAGVHAGRPVYPAPNRQKVGFEDQPIAVYTGELQIRVPLAVDAGAAAGRQTLHGKVRFQSCNDQVCLTPATVAFDVPVTVTAGAAAPGEASSGGTPPARESTSAESAATGAAAPPTGTGFTRGPATGAQAPVPSPAQSGLAVALARGGWLAFLALFLSGLALNLTPCVYPMLGVTVSIFGARRAVPAPIVVLNAVVYVLGIAVLYSALGVIAALTGGMFGALLANIWVQAGIGVVLIVLSLSMFGLYELQPPHQLLSRVSQVSATSLAGTFLSGLFVGVFAAPCIGPAVVALLVVVGAKGDPWFGLRVFFTLSLGLGAPYLVLATFSNLLQRMPRSGEWMVWVKKVFGVILVTFGAFYMATALAPRATTWAMATVLAIGGIYLGFIERSRRGAGFQRLKWAVGIACLVVAVTLALPRASFTLRPFTPDAYQASLARGRAVILDFSANWCVPCHELERATFSDARVRARARDFDAYVVDLTHYDSPDAERLRRQFGVNGVPTVVFLTPSGSEVRAARVEGFMPPAQFLARMALAARGGQQAGRR